MSQLTAIQRELKEKLDHYTSLSEAERTQDKQLNDELNQLRWLELSMSYNRQTQLQFVLHHLGDKGSNPKFRQVQMRPLFSAWKREILRLRWRDVNDIISNQAYGVTLQKRFDQFTNQRTQLTAKNIKNYNFVNNKPILDLIAIDDPFENLNCFQTKEAQSDEFYQQGLNYLASSAVKTFSTLPTEETLDENREQNEELRRRLIARGLILDDEPQEKLLSASERAYMSSQKEDVKKKSNALTITIIIVVLLIICVLIGLYISKMKADEALRIQQEQCYSTITPTPRPTRTPKVKATPTPTPTPKKGWFW